MSDRADKILLGHGGGGRLMRDLVEQVFLARFDNPALRPLGDAAVVSVGRQRLAMTTDGYVVRPLFFPGGDIGKLAACGTVNDLAVVGARPEYLTAGFIIEEGFSRETLDGIVDSMRRVAGEVGFEFVAGDTKVTEKGQTDGLYITTTGIGRVLPGAKIGAERIEAGDKVLVNGPLGDHGVAVISVREGFQFETSVESDCAPVAALSRALIEQCGSGVKFMRDPTRGGLATTLAEIVRGRHFGIVLDEETIPLRPEVSSACEMLGLDPLYVANEGKVVAVVDGKATKRALEVWKHLPLGREARIIGEVVSDGAGKACVRTAVGGTRVLDVLASDPLPRIC